jgi:hypothetical protein
MSKGACCIKVIFPMQFSDFVHMDQSCSVLLKITSKCWILLETRVSLGVQRNRSRTISRPLGNNSNLAFRSSQFAGYFSTSVLHDGKMFFLNSESKLWHRLHTKCMLTILMQGLMTRALSSYLFKYLHQESQTRKIEVKSFWKLDLDHIVPMVQDVRLHDKKLNVKPYS